MESALQYQITYEYNRTALPSNVTDAETNRITAAWDIMQIEVPSQYSSHLHCLMHSLVTLITSAEEECYRTGSVRLLVCFSGDGHVYT